MRDVISFFAGIFLLGLAESSGAQPLATTAGMPAREISADLGVFGLSDHHPSGMGIHVTRNYSPVLGMEVGVTGEQRSAERGGNVLVTVNGRFRVPDLNTGRDVFATLGVGRASGMTFRYSPFIGLGIQRTVHDPVIDRWFGLRLELQRFVRGERGRDRTRLVIGAHVGF